MCHTRFGCSVKVVKHKPSLVLHNRTVESYDAVAMYIPSGENNAPLIIPSCPSRDSTHSQLLASQVLAVPSSEADRTDWPAGEKTALRMDPLCPSTTPSRELVATSHMCRWWPSAATRRVLVGLNERASTVVRPWPSGLTRSLFGGVSGSRASHTQMCSASALLADGLEGHASHLLSGEKDMGLWRLVTRSSLNPRCGQNVRASQRWTWQLG